MLVKPVGLLEMICALMPVVWVVRRARAGLIV